MALTIDQQSQFKHFCKICKKGFLCGRALGGHMRAHCIGDEGGCLDDDDDQASDWEDKNVGGNTPPREKRMYALRTNPNRQKCYRACENCGKEFSSWKSFLEHGKCNSDDVESLVSSHEYNGEDDSEKRPYGSSWSKRKRSFRTNVDSLTPNTCPSSEEEDLANCLMMLSNAMVDTSTTDYQLEESCASASKEEERRNQTSLITPFTTSSQAPPTLDYKAKGISSVNSKGLFECKACKKVFTSHQALGGHRASHKKVKGCFAARLDHIDQDSLGDHEDHRGIAHDPEFTRPTKSICTTLQLEHARLQSPLTTNMPKRKSKVHECSICHRVFNSGQALGGHKRCHWITSNSTDPSSLARFQELREQIEQIQEMPMFKNNNSLDLNMSTSHDQNIMGVERNPSSSLSFQVSTDIFLQPWTATGENEHNNHHKPPQEKGCEDDKNGATKKNNTNGYDLTIVPNNNNNKEDEADNEIKLARICEIKDHMGTNGCSSPWLQVGIGSSNPVEANP